MTTRAMMFTGFVILMVAIFASAYANDVASCHRSQVTRRSLIGQEQFAMDASQVRAQAAALERKTDPAKYALDSKASVRYAAAAKKIHVEQLTCSGPLP